MASKTVTKLSKVPTRSVPEISNNKAVQQVGIAHVWEAKHTPDQAFEQLKKISDDQLARLLANRGIDSAEEAESFLSPRYETLLSNIKSEKIVSGLSAASALLVPLLKSKETIVVFGDYDVDGVCGTSLLSEVFSSLGAKVIPMLPDREKDGYGLQEGSVEEILAHKPAALVTVDNGSSSGAAIKLLRDKGVTVLVVDHHEITEVPTANIVLNPKKDSDNKDVPCATGVAFLLAQTLYQAMEVQPGQEKWLLDLVALATICDMVPLKKDNRTMVLYGLKTMIKTRRPGLQALLEKVQAEIPYDTEVVGFHLGPRLNAAGRIEHASSSLKLLMAKNSEEANTYVDLLENLNRERQALMLKVIEEAREQAKQYASDPCLVLARADWPKGVCGLAAGRLAEELNRPVFVLQKGEPSVGSGRSPTGFDLARALNEMSDLFDKAGGHAAAAGCTLAPQNIEPFRKQLREVVLKRQGAQIKERRFVYELELTLADINEQLLNLQKQLEPYGMSNERPLIRINKCRVNLVRPVGKTQKHLSFTLGQDSQTRRAIAFGKADKFLVKTGDTIDVLGYIKENNWNGLRRAEIEIIDVQLTA